MFNPVLRKRGRTRLVYSTSVGFRGIFVVTALIIVLSVLSVSGAAFFARLNVFTVVVLAGCLFASLYLERWIFDKKTNVLERDVGILFLHWRKTLPLDGLQKVVLREVRRSRSPRIQLFRRASQRGALLILTDRNERVYQIDVARGGAVSALRVSAQDLAAFCDIPFAVEGEEQHSEAEYESPLGCASAAGTSWPREMQR